MSGSTTTYPQEEPEGNSSLLLSVTILIILVLAIVGLLLIPASIDKTPMVGDTWEFYGTGDPFNKDETYTRKVIGVKQNYVQFIENRKDTLTRTIPVFMFNSELISRLIPLEIIESKLDTVPLEIIELKLDTIPLEIIESKLDTVQ